MFFLFCDFENGMCGWILAIGGGVKLKWIRINIFIFVLNIGFLWGYFKGFFYIYINIINVRVFD